MTAPNVDRSTTRAPDAGTGAGPASRGDDADAVRIPREDLRRLVHDLRNQLNSILMNAGVATRLCGDRERMARHVAQFETEGERCAQTLQSIADRYL